MTGLQRITVFGANGRVGALVVKRLADRGYRVCAFVHGEPHERIKGVQYIQGDVADNVAVREALNGAEAVISTLGSWGTPTKDILTRGMEVIIPAMERAGVARIVSLTGADAWTSAQYVSKNGFIQTLSHFAISLLAGKIVRDGERHMQLLEASTLDWTVLRSPVMNEKGRSGGEITNHYPMPWRTIHRHAVAGALVTLVEQPGSASPRAPYITRK